MALSCLSVRRRFRIFIYKTTLRKDENLARISTSPAFGRESLKEIQTLDGPRETV